MCGYCTNDGFCELHSCANDKYGFSALPSGIVKLNIRCDNGKADYFYMAGTSAIYCSASTFMTLQILENGYMDDSCDCGLSYFKDTFCSIRCIQD